MKYLTILVVFVLLSNFANSQGHKFELGVVGGGNRVHTGRSYIGEDFPIGITIGVSFQHNFKRRLSLTYKLLFQESAVVSCYPYGCGTIDVISPYTFKLKERFVLLPVLARFSYGKKKLKMFFDFGVQLVWCYQTNTIKEDYLSGDKEFSKSNKNWKDLAATAGLGLSYPIAKKLTVLTELRWTSSYGAYDRWYGTRNAQLLLGVTYGFDKKLK
jgi:opacity protein-like surface antigen